MYFVALLCKNVIVTSARKLIGTYTKINILMVVVHTYVAGRQIFVVYLHTVTM